MKNAISSAFMYYDPIEKKYIDQIVANASVHGKGSCKIDYLQDFIGEPCDIMTINEFYNIILDVREQIDKVKEKIHKLENGGYHATEAGTLYNKIKVLQTYVARSQTMLDKMKTFELREIQWHVVDKNCAAESLETLKHGRMHAIIKQQLSRYARSIEEETETFDPYWDQFDQDILDIHSGFIDGLYERNIPYAFCTFSAGISHIKVKRLMRENGIVVRRNAIGSNSVIVYNEEDLNYLKIILGADIIHTLYAKEFLDYKTLLEKELKVY